MYEEDKENIINAILKAIENGNTDPMLVAQRACEAVSYVRRYDDKQIGATTTISTEISTSV